MFKIFFEEKKRKFCLKIWLKEMQMSHLSYAISSQLNIYSIKNRTFINYRTKKSLEKMLPCFHKRFPLGSFHQVPIKNANNVRCSINEYNRSYFAFPIRSKFNRHEPHDQMNNWI